MLAKLGVGASDRTRIAGLVAKSWNVRRADVGTRVELTLDAQGAERMAGDLAVEHLHGDI